MQKTERDIIDALAVAIENTDAKLPAAEQARLERLRAVHSRWMGNPTITDTQMRDYITTQFGTGVVQAYRDIAMVKAVFGNTPLSDKEFQRHKANYILEKATAAATAGDSKQAKALTKIAETIIKANRLDEPDGEEYNWDEIVPAHEEFSVDPVVIGIQKVPDIENKARRLLKQYNDDIDEQ